MLLMFIVLQWASLNNSTGFADLNLVLHPNYKLDYFWARKQEKEWIETAQTLVDDEFEANYAGINSKNDTTAIVISVPTRPPTTLSGTSFPFPNSALRYYSSEAALHFCLRSTQSSIWVPSGFGLQV
jgi:hypothetical protein